MKSLFSFVLALGLFAATAGAADYPLTTCVVSGKSLDSMGGPYVHVHQVEGQPDREVQFCCKGCLPRFNANPAAYLAKIDAAQAAAAPSATAAKPACCTGDGCCEAKPACCDANGQCSAPADAGCCVDGHCTAAAKSCCA